MRSWDIVAPVYDLQLALERPAITAALDLAQPRSTDRLLDVATGTGAVLRLLAGRVTRPDDAVGVDRSARMLSRVPPLPAGWRLLRADVQTLPLPDARFDVATCAYLLHLLPGEERTRTLAQIRRVLAPGGRFVTVTPVAPPTRFGSLVRKLVGGYLLDPRVDLERAGFTIRVARYVRAGYPSVCVLSEPNAVR
jgi:demethylmenaquinone methyltransferase/2-methoxy-6-polyprenyl-1,4-benzoquinol methylase